MGARCLDRLSQTHPQHHCIGKQRNYELTRIWGIIHVDVHAVSVSRLALQLLLLLLDLVFALAVNVDAAVLGHLIILTRVFTVLSGNTGHSSVTASGRRLAVGGCDFGRLLAVFLSLVCTVILIIRSEIGLWLLRGEFGRSSRIIVP